jgi:NAD(P)-dependent dehydrogenase (short-subunit alcohol dehydrogenase family)
MNSLFSIEGRVALVTGGNSGLGRAIAMALRDAGARVAIAGRRADRNAAVAAELGADCAAIELDVGNEGSVERGVRDVADRFGRLDVLVNCAGMVRRGSVMALERVLWDQILAANLTGAFLCTKHSAQIMAPQQSGVIVNIASVYALTGRARGC